MSGVIGGERRPLEREVEPGDGVIPAGMLDEPAGATSAYPWIKGRAGGCRLQGDGVVAQFGRFVMVGGSSNVVYALIFLLLHSHGALVANVGGVVVSTALANEVHRRLTFHASQRVHWFSAQWEAGGLAVVGLGISSTALAVLDFSFPEAPGAAQALLVVAVSAVIGVLRFLALRGWVFSV